MKHVFIGIGVIAMLTALLLRVLPWWCGSLVAFVVVYLLRLRPGRAFLAGFLGVGLAWAAVAGWVDYQNDSILSMRIGTLFMGMSPIGVIMITGLLGALSGGLGGITGGLLLARRIRRNLWSQ